MTNRGFEWHHVEPVDMAELAALRREQHYVLQSVAAIGRLFGETSATDEQATLVWVPGLSRLAGQWVEGDFSFRASLSIEEATVYLVDRRVQVFSSFCFPGKTQRQLLLWLEEQMGKLGLEAADLGMKAPYALPPGLVPGHTYSHWPDSLLQVLAGYFHNGFVLLREMKAAKGIASEIRVWPQHLEQSLHILVRDSGDMDTSAHISIGMSPGDEDFESPYFFVKTWPHVHVETAPKLQAGMWMADHWTGALLPAKVLLSERDQLAFVRQFYETAYDELFKLLTN